MYKGIVAYSAEVQNGNVVIEKAYDNKGIKILFNNWDEMANFLVTDMGDALHIVWNMPKFASSIFTLLPSEKRNEFKHTTRVYHGSSKIFYTERILGITVITKVKGNIYTNAENNFYAIQRWMPNGSTPESITKLKELGEQLLEALELLGLYPEKLTSPVGIYEDELLRYNLPTIWSNEDELLVEACNYCLPIIQHEWREEFSQPTNGTRCYDMIAAYPSIIADLPNTDNCNIQHSESPVKSHWGIMKGTVRIFRRPSPIGCDTHEDLLFPIGKWDTYLTTDEWRFIYKFNIGSFTIDNGYFFTFNDNDKPYNEVITKLFNMRQNHNEIASTIVKKIAQGISGKLDQENQDGRLGDLYNPVLALMTRSRCRLAVARFIYSNKLENSLVSINVDEVKANKYIQLENSNTMGSWRNKV